VTRAEATPAPADPGVRAPDSADAEASRAEHARAARAHRVAWPASLRRRAELAWGRAQLELLHRGVAAFAGLATSRLPIPGGELTLFSRPGHGTSGAARPLPLVCMHGFGGDKETWLLLAAALGRAVPLYALDLPGHGDSTMPETPVTIACHAGAAIAAMDRLGIQRAVVCGNSMGGGVALRLAVDHPERVAALVLISSVGSDIHHHAAVAAWRTGKNPLIPEEHEVDDFIAAALDESNKIPLSIIRYVATTRARAARRLRRLFDDFTSHHGPAGIPADLSTVAAPALIIHGEKDQIVDRQAAETLHRRLPNAQLHHLAKVGHAPQLEAPRRTALLVRDFLHRIAQR
jgi:abhydrolase domain-containing protein 6